MPRHLCEIRWVQSHGPVGLNRTISESYQPKPIVDGFIRRNAPGDQQKGRRSRLCQVVCMQEAW